MNKFAEIFANMIKMLYLCTPFACRSRKQTDKLKYQVMERICIICLAVLASIAIHAQTVTNVVAKQVGNTVEITYDLDKTADIVLLLSTDGGKYYNGVLSNITGDSGENVSAGHKKIIWDLLTNGDNWDLPNARFMVYVDKKEKYAYSVNGVSFTMIVVEGGSFIMGCTSENSGHCYNKTTPTHLVTLSDYFIGETEVTQKLWKAVMGYNISASRFGDNYPVENVTWEECQYFIKKLNSLLASQLNGKHFALPTEAQWEYAARGGHKVPPYQYKYSGSDIVGSVSWYDENSENKTHPVKTKSANTLGIYDMSGNVCEWCQDWFGDYSSVPQTDPKGPSSGTWRVSRGGCWGLSESAGRVPNRFGVLPEHRDPQRGFRLVLQ